ncbi:MAG: DegV family protein [Clostridia bacterium]|nr:DegV family protein [Clostridia bacterium]
MAIRIITDSTSDILQNEFENVTVIPLTVTIDGKNYRDSVDLSRDEFYTILETSDALPITSLVSPAVFQEAYEKVHQAGDEAIVITVSSVLSGTYQSACLAAESYDSISVVDSLSVTCGLRILVKRAMYLVEKGLRRDEIVRILEHEKKRVRIYASVDTLKYLKKGGRISAGAAIVGGIIGIKPILTLDDGKLIVIGKARGSVQSNRFLDKKIEEAGGVDFDLPTSTAYSGTDNTNLMNYRKRNEALMGVNPDAVEITQIGPTVGTHAGPGAVVVAFFAKKEA